MCFQRKHNCFEIRKLKIQKFYKWTVRAFIHSLIYSLKLFLWLLLLQHHSLDPGTTVSRQRVPFFMWDTLAYQNHGTWFTLVFWDRVFLSGHDCQRTHYVDTQRSACLCLLRDGIKASPPLVHVTFYMRYNFKINYRGSRKTTHFLRCLHENMKAWVWSPESIKSEHGVTCLLSQI